MLIITPLGALGLPVMPGLLALSRNRATLLACFRLLVVSLPGHRRHATNIVGPFTQRLLLRLILLYRFPGNALQESGLLFGYTLDELTI